MSLHHADVEAVITSYDQGSMILEAIQSVCEQTVCPKKIIVVDDGSTDPQSLEVLREIEQTRRFTVPVEVHRQENRGVSTARNAGLRKVGTSMALVLDGDDQLEPEYIETVSSLLQKDPSMVAASSWMQTFGVLDAVVCPTGGDIVPFLSRNCCPATHILRMDRYRKSGGYDETMRSGFEDWEFFLRLLETAPDARIGIAEAPLLRYRTAPASANIKSMEKRLGLMRYLIEQHQHSYSEHLADALLGLELISDTRLMGWEEEIVGSIRNGQALSDTAKQFLQSPSYGDGGMAAAVRIASL